MVRIPEEGLLVLLPIKRDCQQCLSHRLHGLLYHSTSSRPLSVKQGSSRSPVAVLQDEWSCQALMNGLL